MKLVVKNVNLKQKEEEIKDLKKQDVIKILYQNYQWT